MNIFKQTLPASLRADLPGARDNRSVMGADRRPYLVTPAAPRKASNSVRQYPALFPHESEDARLTGATRSLYRRLLALNLPRTERRMEVASQPAHEIAEPRTPLATALTGARIA